jgi:hypothetical protein
VIWTYATYDTNFNTVQVTNTAYYQAHVFTNLGPATCVGVAIQCLSYGGGWVFAAAYLEAFNPQNPGQNYLGDTGYNYSGYERSFSFTVPVGARFVIVASAPGSAYMPYNYRLKVTGGDCPPPALAIAPAPSTAKVAVSWTTASGGYQLESAPALTPTAFARVTNSPAVLAGQFVVTNAAAGTNRFYRLHRP